MTVGRTADARFAIDTGTDLRILDNILGGAIAGDGNITRQAYIGETFEQASVHSAGGGVSFTTIYQTTAFEALAAAAASNPNTPTQFAVICEPTPTSWQIIPVSWPRASYDAPADDAITRPWSLMRRGIGWVGTRVDAFDVDSVASTVIGDQLDDGLAFIALSGYGNRTRVRTTGANITGHIDLDGAALRTGIFGPLDVDGDDRDLSITITGPDGDVTGWVLSLGKQEVIPSG